MIRMVGLLLLLMGAVPLTVYAQTFETDVFKTSRGSLSIAFLGHGSVMFAFDDKIIHVDPYSAVADYSQLPKADLVLITHEHRDHLDRKALDAVCTPSTILVVNEAGSGSVKNGFVMHNGGVREFLGLKIEAVPAYNLVHMRSEGVPLHAKGAGNGYVITFGDKHVYIAGDTENIPEMKALKDIDIAFLPMNLPYTMTPEMTADAARSFKPRILYPYHYGETDTAKIVDLLKGEQSIEVRIRKMK